MFLDLLNVPPQELKIVVFGEFCTTAFLVSLGYT